MPFTLTHTLAVLPVARRVPALPLSALCVGAMVPDWSLFIPIGPGYDVMHSWVGVLTACVPLGIALFMLYRFVYRRALIELIPSSLQNRLTKFQNWQTRFGAVELLLAGLAVALGAASHLLWDAFTHHGRWGVELLPLLSGTVLQLGESRIQGHEIFQHGSSVVGLPLLALLSWRWLRVQPCTPGKQSLLGVACRWRLLALLALLPVLIAAGRQWLRLEQQLTLTWLHDALIQFVTDLGMLWFVLFTVYSLVLFILDTGFEQVQAPAAAQQAN